MAGELVAVRQDHQGQWYAICEVDGNRVLALANTEASEHVGEPVTLVYSRVDADGALREVRLAPATGGDDRPRPRRIISSSPQRTAVVITPAIRPPTWITISVSVSPASRRSN